MSTIYFINKGCEHSFYLDYLIIQIITVLRI